jgi:hypothetical protein
VGDMRLRRGIGNMRPQGLGIRREAARQGNQGVEDKDAWQG